MIFRSSCLCPNKRQSAWQRAHSETKIVRNEVCACRQMSEGATGSAAKVRRVSNAGARKPKHGKGQCTTHIVSPTNLAET